MNPNQLYRMSDLHKTKLGFEKNLFQSHLKVTFKTYVHLMRWSFLEAIFIRTHFMWYTFIQSFLLIPHGYSSPFSTN